MYHRKMRRKLGRKSEHRIALLRNLLKSLVLHKRIQTTVMKAKEASAFSDSMIELAKKGDLHSRRVLIARLGCSETAGLLIKEIAPQFKDRKGGYTRVLKLGYQRPGDGGQKAILEFTAAFESTQEKRAKALEKKKKKAEKEAAKEAEKAAEAVKEKKPAKEKAKAKAEKPKEEEKPKSKAKEKEPEAESSDSGTAEKKEGEKKGGFLGTLRKFLKGDE
ncbi:MAG: 50S ribosomal protein L17 [Candidatus Omnitrophica bacterium]|nr:50S ribosomal protein L17 [Candidatus Omnitrophota bacterium]